MDTNNGQKKTVLAASHVTEKVYSAYDVIHIGAEKARWERAKMGASSANDELLAKLLLDLYFYWFASRIELKNIRVIRPKPQKRLDEIDAEDDDDVAHDLDKDEDKGGERSGKKNKIVALKVENKVKVERASTEGDGVSDIILSDVLMNVEKKRSNIKYYGPTTTSVASLELTTTSVGVEPKSLDDVVPHLDCVKKELEGVELDDEELGGKQDDVKLCMDVSCLEEWEAHEDSHSTLIVAEENEDGRWDEQLKERASLSMASQTRDGKKKQNSQQKNSKQQKRVKQQHQKMKKHEKNADARLKKMIGKRSTKRVASDRKKRTVGGINSDYVDGNSRSENCLSEAGMKNMGEEQEKKESKMKRGRGRPKKTRENIRKVLKVRGRPKEMVRKGNRPTAEEAETWRKKCYEYFDVVDDNKKAICRLCHLPVNIYVQTLTKHLKHDHGLVKKDNCIQALSCDEPGCAESIFHSHRAYLLHKQIVHKQFVASSQRAKEKQKAEVCSICGQLSKILVSHMRTIHNPKVTCPQSGCGMLVREHTLRRHMMTHTSGICPYPDCNTKFNSKSQIDHHIQMVHQNKNNHQCPHCHLTAATADNLKRHIKEVHNSGIMYPCPEPGCGQVFKRQRTCNQHAKLHLKIKPFQCVWCNFTGTQHNNIRSHALTKHREDFSKLKLRSGEKYWRRTDSQPMQNSIDSLVPS